MGRTGITHVRLTGEIIGFKHIDNTNVVSKVCIYCNQEITDKECTGCGSRQYKLVHHI